MKRVKDRLIKISVFTAVIGLAAAVILWAALNGSSVAVYAANGDYTIDGEIGFGGFAKINSHVPVAITAANNTDKTFKGRIGAVVADNGNTNSSWVYGEAYKRFSQEVEIAPGGSAAVSLAVPIDSTRGEMQIQLLDNKNVVLEKELSFNVCSHEECWVGVLSRNSDSLSYLKPSYFDNTSGRVTDLKSVLDRSSALDAADTSSVDVYVINDYDLAELRDLQLWEIMNNVSNGAVMLIGGGSPISSLDRLRLDTLQKCQTSYYFDAGGNYFDYSFDEAYCTGYRLGKGYIINTKTDLGYANSAKDAFGAINNMDGLSSLISYTFQYTRINRASLKYSTENRLSRYAHRLPNLTDNKIKLIFVLIYLYVLFIPLLYFCLKKRDKKEAAVKIISAAALAVTLIIYLISLNTVYKKPIATIVSYVDLGNVTESQGIAKTAMYLLSPDKGDITVELSGSPKADSEISYGYGVTQSKDKEEAIKADIVYADDITRVGLKDKTRWEKSDITFSDSYRLRGNIECTARIDPSRGKLTGEIKNNTGEDFEQFMVAVVADNSVCTIKRYGAVAAGEGVDLSALNFSIKTALRNRVNNIIYYGYYREREKEDSYRGELINEIAADLFGEYDTYVGSDVSFTEINDVRLVALGFTKDCICGGDTRVNNKRLISSGTGVFKNEFNVDISGFLEENGDYRSAANLEISSRDNAALEEDKLHIPNTDLENNEGRQPAADLEISGCDNAALEGDKLHILNTDREAEISFYNPSRKDFSIAWNTEGSKSVYNRNYSWVGLGSSSLVYTDKDGFIDDNGYVRIRILSSGSDYVSLPEITYYD